MSQKKRRQKARPPRRRQEQQQSTSLVLPIFIGFVLVAVIVAVIVSFEERRSTPAIAAIPTAAPLSTQSIPFSNVPRISVEETQQRAAAGEVVIVDVRAASSYQQSHIAGAISAPETEIEEWIDELPRDVELVLY